MKILRAVQSIYRGSFLYRLIRGVKREIESPIIKKAEEIYKPPQFTGYQPDDCHVEWEEPEDFSMSYGSTCGIGYGRDADRIARALYNLIKAGREADENSKKDKS